MRGLLAALLILVCAVTGAAPSALSEAERAELLAEGRNNQARKLETWASWLARPLTARTGPAPTVLLEYLAIDNRLNGYSGIPTSSTDLGLRGLLRAALQGLPAEVLRIVDDRLAAVVIVRDLGSSGFTDVIRDTEGNPVAGFIVLDELLFARRANAWASWRDSNAFLPDPRFRIETHIASKEDDSRLVAVQFLLLHELAHIFAIGRDIHPPWGDDPTDHDLRDFPFADLAWEIDYSGASYRSRHEAVFPLRGSIRFYREPGLPATQIPQVLAQLQRTPFVSLYAATRPEEDFAESFAIYVHRELLGRPYVSKAIVDDHVELRFTPCFPDRCRQKYRFLQSLFQP